MTDKTQYPELPKHLHTAGYLANSPPLYTAAQMIEFADATCALRVEQVMLEMQEDSARLNWLIEQRAYVVSDPDACQGYWLHWAYPDGSTWVQVEEYETPRAAIDAARAKQISDSLGTEVFQDAEGTKPVTAAGEAIQDAEDAERFRFLTEDHANPAAREFVRSLCERLPVISYSAACAAIDSARAQQEGK